MSEQQRQLSSPFLNSPGRLPPVARPEWPWSRSYGQRASHPSVYSATTTVPGQGQMNWDPSRSSTSSVASSNGTPLPWRSNTMAKQVNSSLGLNQVETTRQWFFIGLEWIVRDLQRLKGFLESDSEDNSPPQNASQNQTEDFEVLKQSPIMGDKFKLEIACMFANEENMNPSRDRLCLYMTSLLMDFTRGDEMPASMMAAIRCQDNRAGERGNRADWVWQFWQHDWVFRQESEVWECPLPPLSELLHNPRVRETDSFVLCVQVHSPVGPSIPEQPSVAYVPRDLLDGLEALLDNPNTGDVRFVCLEKFNPETPVNRDSPDTGPDVQGRPLSATSSQSAFSQTTTARKRVIYAHSDVLSKRSEYFSTMLSSAFAENAEPAPGGRKIYTVIVEEADFETIYWLLKFCYANWLLFKEQDDPRAAVEGVGAGWSAKWLAPQDGEWDWKTFHKSSPGDESFVETTSVTSVESLSTNVTVSQSTSGASDVFQQASATTLTTAVSSSNVSKGTPGTSRSVNRRPSTLPVPASSSSGVPRSKSDNIPLPSNPYTTAKHYPISPRSRPPQPTATPDPHPHPTPAPPPASALSMYQVAHRYTMPGLANLALDHIMSTITPQTSFAYLLATSMWDDLHLLVQDYVVDKWEEVSASTEFEQCCQEIAAGEWGSNGGKTLTAVFRRLRSPNTVG